MNQTCFISLCFFLSGVSALIYEVVWARMLTTVFGASLYAVATVTSVFLGGLAGGAYLAGRFAGGAAQKRIYLYAGIEVCVAVLGALLPFLFESQWFPQTWIHIDQALRTDFLSHTVRFLVASVILLPPTMLMGATLPVLVGAFVRSDRAEDESTQLLYAANTTGGALGTTLAGFLLLPSLGLRVSSLVAAGLNLLAAGGALIATKLAAPSPQPKPKKNANPPPLVAKQGTMITIAFLSGVILLSLQVAWTRWFSLVLGSSVYSLSCVLAIFLFSLAAGAWVARRVLQPVGNGLLLMSTAYFLSTVYILISLYAANEIPWLFVSLSQSFANVLGDSFGVSIAARLSLVAILIACPTFLLGTVLSLLLGAQVENKARFVGYAYSINVLGAIVGALITGFTLIPALSALAASGIRWTLLLNMLAQILLAVWLFMEWTRSFITDPDTRSIVNGIVIFVAVAVILDVACFRPEWNRAIASAGPSFFTPGEMKRLDKESFLAAIGALEGQDVMKFYREGLNATITVAQDNRRNVTFLKNNGKVEAAVPTDPIQPSQGADNTTHLLLGLLPPRLVSGDDLNALVIGYGSGTTSGAVLSDVRVKQLTIAELESAVYAADRFFSQSTGNPLGQTARISPLVNDGRYVLGTSRSDYDLMVCQPSDPWVAGAAELFTVDFWDLAKAHLKPNGMISQWVQMYSIAPRDFIALIRTFKKVFPNCCLVVPQRAGECILIAANTAAPLSEEQVKNSMKTQSAMSDQLPAGYRSLGNIVQEALILGPGQVDTLLARHPEQRINTDDRNFVEFAAAKGAATQLDNIDQNVKLLKEVKR